MNRAGTVDSAEAEQALRSIEAARTATRGTLGASWLAFFIWGAIVLISAPFTQVGDGSAVGIYWAVVVPIGFLVTWRSYRALELRLGIEDRNEWLYPVIAAAMAAGAFVTGAAGDDMLSAVGPLFSIGLGLVVMALVKSLGHLVVLAGGAMIALGMAIAITEPVDPSLMAAIGQGLILLCAGLISYYRYRGSGAGSGAAVS